MMSFRNVVKLFMKISTYQEYHRAAHQFIFSEKYMESDENSIENI